jgi:hypothetical protein
MSHWCVPRSFLDHYVLLPRLCFTSLLCHGCQCVFCGLKTFVWKHFLTDVWKCLRLYGFVEMLCKAPSTHSQTFVCKYSWTIVPPPLQIWGRLVLVLVALSLRKGVIFSYISRENFSWEILKKGWFGWNSGLIPKTVKGQNALLISGFWSPLLLWKLPIWLEPIYRRLVWAPQIWRVEGPGLLSGLDTSQADHVDCSPDKSLVWSILWLAGHASFRFLSEK